LQTLQDVLLARHLLRPRDDPLSHHLQIHLGGDKLNRQSRTSLAGSDLSSKTTKPPQHPGHLPRLRRSAGGQLHICCFVGVFVSVFVFVVLLFCCFCFVFIFVVLLILFFGESNFYGQLAALVNVCFNLNLIPIFYIIMIDDEIKRSIFGTHSN
jgi:hypothetical protein